MHVANLMRPMSEFDPAEPAILHELLNGDIVPWTGERQAQWRKHARPRGDGIIEWEGHLFDGWDEPLGG
jgi:hypothetical protein